MVSRPIGLHRQLQPDGLGDGDQRRKTRIAAGRQGSIQALPFDPRGLGNLGDASPRLGDTTQRDKQDFRLVRVIQCGLQVLDGEFRVITQSTNDGLVVRNAGFRCHCFRVLR